MRFLIGTRLAPAPELALAVFVLAASAANARPARATVAIAAAAKHAGAAAHRLPPIVFVSRHAPTGADAGQIPGLGPHARALAPGGRLLVRDRDGRVRALLPEDALWDVSDPAVAPDGRRIAFAGTTAPDSAWRIFLIGADGQELRALTRTDRDLPPEGDAAAREPVERYDDLDPCWIGEHQLVFASTRFPLLSEYGGVPATNLYRVDDSGTAPVRLTTERNGIEEPAFDPASGRVIASRWWTNRWRASNLDSTGVTTDPARALPADSANLWQAVALDPARPDPVLAAGDPRTRAACMAYQPAVLPGGAIACVYARHLALSPDPGGVGIEIFGGPGAPRFAGLPRTIGPPERLAGPVFSELPGDPYADARGLAAPQACSPAALPDGRILFAYDPGARGDFGVWVMRADGSHLEPVTDLPGTLELDPVPLVRWDPGPHARRQASNAVVAAVNRPRPRPARTRADLEDPDQRTFSFHALNLFANAAVDAPLPDAPPPAPSLRMRFFAALARPGTSGGDSVALLCEAPVARGEINARGLPADAPLFEQVVRANGSVLMSAHGPAHVAGFNSGSGGERRCVGCHVGHSAIVVPATLEQARWFNAAPAAAVVTSSVAPGCAGARAAVDRRARGAPAEVAWIAADAVGEQWLRLSWPVELMVRELRLYGPEGASRIHGAPVPACGVRFLRAGREVGRTQVPAATARARAVRIEPVTVDAIELHFPAGSRGTTPRRAIVVAEVEVIARLP